MILLSDDTQLPHHPEQTVVKNLPNTITQCIHFNKDILEIAQTGFQLVSGTHKSTGIQKEKKTACQEYTGNKAPTSKQRYASTSTVQCKNQHT